MGSITGQWVTDVAERVIMAFLITAMSTWLVAPALDHDVVKAAITAGVVAAGTLVKTIITTLLNGTPSAVPATAAVSVKS